MASIKVVNIYLNKESHIFTQKIMYVNCGALCK